MMHKRPLDGYWVTTHTLSIVLQSARLLASVACLVTSRLTREAREMPYGSACTYISDVQLQRLAWMYDTPCIRTSASCILWLLLHCIAATAIGCCAFHVCTKPFSVWIESLSAKTHTLLQNKAKQTQDLIVMEAYADTSWCMHVQYTPATALLLAPDMLKGEYAVQTIWEGEREGGREGCSGHTYHKIIRSAYISLHIRGTTWLSSLSISSKWLPHCGCQGMASRGPTPSLHHFPPTPSICTPCKGSGL